MRAGQIEATFAKFDFARFLYLHDIAFKFVMPVGMKGKDYDLAIQYADGREACADAIGLSLSGARASGRPSSAVCLALAGRHDARSTALDAHYPNVR